ncbi:transketolase [Lawsonia intracellularis]|nr:transketolase [Lawsonia intracellularis]KAA0205471.1 transketolase [Lawsonia intracellularis]MBZ3892341.1 transketolase [Lawsonia intracellularis]OMQ05989.1 transketolase [Lawsonia intracellularis]RBN32584.1 transketolase [Lawsonia intracellularis]RBN34148.1 transketolase [Lawsonia intracellularis]
MPSRKELANVLRILTIDAVEKANSGHPGAPMGMADIAESLWRCFLKHNPSNPQWINRDRFILSNGHASMLLYGVLHLSGYDLSIDDIQNFRQLHSKTPGHPEYKCTPGVEVTTGPLGQGLAVAVGMAMAERLLATTFNREHFPIIDHYTYVFVGDGCLMEGISQEACSFAGTHHLGKLIVFYDNNGISIDGKVNKWFTDDTPARFNACGWHVIPNIDGHNAEAIDSAIILAKSITDKPTLICCNTIIGYGSPNKSNSQSSHGAPLGKSECDAVRTELHWKSEPFQIPEQIYKAWDCRKKGTMLENEWNELYSKYCSTYPELSSELERRIQHILPECWNSLTTSYLQEIEQNKIAIATRVASKNTLDIIAPCLPELIGGSADLSGSVGTIHSHTKYICNLSYDGNYLSYGVREFLMGSIMNGIALHGGFIPYGGTFLVFSDYAKAAIRLSAMMNQHVIWLLSHDSIGVGEDGPTHQPIEHISSLRLIPNLNVWRPCDAVETTIAWEKSIESQKTSCITLSRQPLTYQSRTKEQISNIQYGGYILYEPTKSPELILIATGSEVELAITSAIQLEKEGYAIRVVSMPCTSIFDSQPKEYKELVLPSTIRKRIAIEAAITDYWWKYVGFDGDVVGIDTFGESAPAQILFSHFGFTKEHIISKAKNLLQK